MVKAVSGCKVSVHYTGSFLDGSVFDSSEKHGQPLEFTVGAGQVVKGFDDAVLGMSVGEEKTVTIKSEDAYGSRNEQLVRDFPRSQLPPTPEPKVGMMLGMTLPNGQQVPAMITQVTSTSIRIDLNHPLAGKTLVFKLKLVSVATAPS